jgi:hypothetical protein
MLTMFNAILLTMIDNVLNNIHNTTMLAKMPMTMLSNAGYNATNNDTMHKQ